MVNLRTKVFADYCEENEIEHNFTPQQNRVVERKNRSLPEIAKTMMIGTALHLTESFEDHCWKKHPMSYQEEENQEYSTFRSLFTNATY